MNFRKGQRREDPEINLIPFIDVLLVILIFLMVTTTYSKFTELQITLPTADAQKATDKPFELNVTVDAKGNYTINGEPVSFRDVGGFAQAMRDAAAKAGDPGKSPVVIVNADQFAMHQMVINVMEAARIAGYEKLTFAAQTSAANKSALEATLTRAWLRRGPLACLLWPVSLLFRLLSGVRAALFRAGVIKSTRLPVPVVVVGNIYIGGTGKTPLTIWLVQALQAAGMRPGVISRGFGGDADGAREVDAASSPARVGDEPLLIKRRTGCPVMVGRDRAATGRALLAAHPDLNILLTDDGLQHYALRRDVEIILFDGRGAGNGWLLPAGPLREPVSRRRDFTVINAPELSAGMAASVGAAAPWQMVLAGDVAEQLSDRGARLTLSELAARTSGGGLRVTAAAGIGNPARFFGMLRAAGLHFSELPLPDHHDFQDRPFAALDTDLILMTEKDAVKCAQIEELRDDPRLWVVPVSAQLDGALANQIVEKCRGRSIA